MDYFSVIVKINFLKMRFVLTNDIKNREYLIFGGV